MYTLRNLFDTARSTTFLCKAFRSLDLSELLVSSWIQLYWVSLPFTYYWYSVEYENFILRVRWSSEELIFHIHPKTYLLAQPWHWPWPLVDSSFVSWPHYIPSSCLLSLHIPTSGLFVKSGRLLTPNTGHSESTEVESLEGGIKPWAANLSQ